MMRRSALIAATVLVSTVAAPVGGSDAGTDPAPTPAEALERLKAGNARFVAGEMTHPNLSEDVRCSTFHEGQRPLVTVLGCADSRVPPELIFDAGLGELFVVRVAGNVADTDEVGTVEYGAGHLHTPLIVVMGHSKCGAVTAVVNGAELHGSLPRLVDNVAPAADAARGQGLTGDRLIKAAIALNVRQSQADLLSRSEELRSLVGSGKVQLVGAVYDLHGGTIEWLGEHPRQSQLLSGEGSVNAAHPEPRPAENGHGTPAAAPASTPAKAHAVPAPPHAAPAKAPAHAGPSTHADSPAHGATAPHPAKSRASTKGHAAPEAPHAPAAGTKSGEGDGAATPSEPHVAAVDRQGWTLPVVMALGGGALSGGAVFLLKGREASTRSTPETPTAAEAAAH